MSNQTKDTTPTPDRKLIPVTQWPKHHSWPPIGGLRYLIFHRDANGFANCIRRVGRTILIDEARFFEWVDRCNENNAHGQLAQNKSPRSTHSELHR